VVAGWVVVVDDAVVVVVVEVVSTAEVVVMTVGGVVVVEVGSCAEVPSEPSALQAQRAVATARAMAASLRFISPPVVSGLIGGSGSVRASAI
jgi:hypothetical protein